MTCPTHGDTLIHEPGGDDMPTIHGRRYCPTCQAEVMATFTCATCDLMDDGLPCEYHRGFADGAADCSEDAERAERGAEVDPMRHRLLLLLDLAVEQNRLRYTEALMVLDSVDERTGLWERVERAEAAVARAEALADEWSTPDSLRTDAWLRERTAADQIRAALTGADQ